MMMGTIAGWRINRPVFRSVTQGMSAAFVATLVSGGAMILLALEGIEDESLVDDEYDEFDEWEYRDPWDSYGGDWSYPDEADGADGYEWQDDAGHDVTMFGATTGKYLQWD